MQLKNLTNQLGLSFHPSMISEIGENKLLDMLNENNVSHIELALENKEYANRFIDAGFTVSYHGPLNWLSVWLNDENHARDWLDGLISKLPREVTAQKNKPVLIMHPATQAIDENTQLSRSELFSISVEFIQLVNELAEKYFGGCTIALENLTHGKSKVRIGDTLDELIELKRSIGLDNIKFCWDIGHYIMSQRFLQEQNIPDEFLDNIAIVHLHGVEGKDRPREKWWDHYPLTSNSISWEKYIRLLQSHGYTGPVVLEIFRLRQSTKITVEHLNNSFKEIKNQLEWNQRLLRRKRWLKPLFEHTKPGKIVEFGCGSGFVLEDLSGKFPKSQIVGIDMNQERLDTVAEKNLGNVETRNADITTRIFPDQSIDTVLYIGVLHEIFSLFGREKVLETLKLGHQVLKDDGILIIQDFLKPPPEPVTFSFKNQKTEDMFFRFTREFRIRNIEYEKIEGGVKLDIGDAIEFLTKYRSPTEEHWQEEMDESHHYFTRDEFHEVANEASFTVKDSLKLLMTDDYFEEIREDVDFDFDESERAWIQLVLEKKR